MPAELVAVLAVALTIVGVCGIVVPVLPGSLAILSGLLVWALFGGSSTGWLVFGVGAVLTVAGASASYVITGKRLKEREIPNRSVMVGVICGVVGLFVLPFLGLLVGFVVGLFGMEWWRVRQVPEALRSSWTALTSVGLGMLMELGCGLLAAAVLLVGILTSFLG
ncbi:MAG: DUF456 domain-containing protein [Propioniciclava sp.]